MLSKLRLIFFPFITLSACIIGLCTLVHWLLFIQLFEVREEIPHIWLPILLSILGGLLLYPRIKLLKLSKNLHNLAYAVLAVILIVVPTVMAQNHLSRAFGEITPLAKISAVDTAKKTRYYSLKEAFISKRDLGTHLSVKPSGQHNARLSLSLFLALPVYDSWKSSKPSAWLGVKYHKDISNRLSEDEKETLYNEFLDKTEHDFKARDVQRFAYLERIGPSYQLDNYTKAIKNSPQYSEESGIIFVPHETPFEARNEGSLMWIVFSYVFGSLFFLIMLIFPKIEKERVWHFEFSLKEWLPTKIFFATPLLIIVNCGIFLFMVLKGVGFASMDSEALLKWGANYGPLVREGEYWRLLSSTFLHGGVFHLAANMAALYYAGVCLEPFLGKFKIFGAYILFGILASLASFYYSGDLSVGASGAILGLYGFGLTLFYLTKALDDELKSVFLNILGTIAFASLVMGFIYPNIDNAAHIGGFLSGALAGFLFARFGSMIFHNKGKFHEWPGR